MTKGAKVTDGDDAGRVVDFDHITFWVGNAKAAANYFVTRLGFQPFAVKESKDEISLAVRLNKITIVFQSPTAPSSPLTPSLSAHGDFVKDVALQVSDLDALVARAARGGAEVLRGVTTEGGEGGDVRYCVLKTYGANTHTLIDRGSYKGHFLPGYKTLEGDVLNTLLPDTKLEFIDHVEGNLSDGTLEESVSWYEKNLNMKRFWCVDYKHDLVPYACINSNSVINKDETVLLSMNEAAKGLRPSSKVTDFVNALGAASVEHIALYTDDIVATMRSLKARGAEVVSFPAPYYDIIREKLEGSALKVSESIDVLQELDILIDFDERGYMLQAFTKHLQVRPTVFVEVIQRRNHRGFGAMNYKWVFEAIERLDKETNKEKDEKDQKEESST